MPRRSTPLINGEYYHIFNRGVNRSKIFYASRDYSKFLEIIDYYKRSNVKIRLSYWNPITSPLDNDSYQIEIVCYCLMPNHFHFLIRQISDDGILNFMRKVQNSYTKYFNIKNSRTGPLLQGRFKAVRIESNEQFIHVSRYIHLNPIVSFLEKDIRMYRWSSFWELYHNKKGISKMDEILQQFKTKEDFISFIEDHKDYAIKLEYIKHLLHENPDV